MERSERSERSGTERSKILRNGAEQDLAERSEAQRTKRAERNEAEQERLCITDGGAVPQHVSPMYFDSQEISYSCSVMNP